MGRDPGVPEAQGPMEQHKCGDSKERRKAELHRLEEENGAATAGPVDAP
ncbi:MAG: hypothetical protein ACRDMH_15695 [Solirubrobacterales bacterium]